MIRAVLDTNIMISALLWDGLPGQILQAAFNELIEVLLTEALLNELIDTLSRNKFAAQLVQRQMTVNSIADQYRSAAIFVDPADIPKDAVRDPKDHMVLACAVGGKVDYIVSGDNDLLVIGSYGGVAIVPPDLFLQRLLSE